MSSGPNFDPFLNNTINDKLKTVGLDTMTLIQLLMLVSFLSLVVHLLQLVLTVMSVSFKLVHLFFSIIIGILNLNITIILFVMALPFKILVWLNHILGPYILLSIVLLLATYVYFTVDFNAVFKETQKLAHHKRWKTEL